MLVNLAVQFEAAQVLAHDHPVFIDEKTHGDGVDAVHRRRFTLPALEVGDVPFPVELVLGDGRLPTGHVTVQGHAEHFKAIGRLEFGLLVLVVGVNHVRVFPTARSAPRSPEIHQHQAAAQVAQLHGLAFWIGQGNLWSSIADGRPHLVRWDDSGRIGRLNGRCKKDRSGERQRPEGGFQNHEGNLHNQSTRSMRAPSAFNLPSMSW